MKDIITIWGRLLGQANTINGGQDENRKNKKFLGRSYSYVSTGNHGEEGKKESFAQRFRRRFNGRTNNCVVFKSYVIMALIGMSLVGSGMFIKFVDPYEVIFNWKIKFTDGGEIFEIWRKPPVDLYLRVFLFNVTNKEAFLNGEEKLKVQEVGPYVYKEHMSHDNVTFNDNGTVSAQPYHPLVFVPEMSIGDPDKDVLTLPHIALLSIANVVSELSYLTKLGLNLLVRQTKTHPLVDMTPTEFMFGYASTLMTLGNKFLPGWVNFEKLGLIDRMYNFEGDFETVFTGEHDVTQAGLLDTYNGSPQMAQWESNCGDIRGASDGTKFKSHVTGKENLLFYRKSMCRPQHLIPRNESISSGLRGIVYRFPENGMDNGLHDEENACYCKQKGKCLRKGLLDVKECYYGFPIALSYPHFLDSDQTILDEVEGYEPDRQKHESYFVVEPKSGLPLDLAVRFQINMALGKIGSIAHVSRFEDMVLPLLWTEIRMYNLPDELAKRFQLYLNVLPLFTDTLMKGGFLVGAILTAVAVYMYIRKDQQPQPRRQSWFDEDADGDFMDINLTAYKPDRKHTIPEKELQVYYNSLVAPLNQDLELDDHEYDFRL